jgi:hypothetical protein
MLWQPYRKVNDWQEKILPVALSFRRKTGMLEILYEMDRARKIIPSMALIACPVRPVAKRRHL